MVFIAVLIVSFILQLFLPWWVMVIVSFIACAIMGKNNKISFWQPFFAIVLLWLTMALFKSIPNQHLLAGRVANMFGLKVWPAILAVSALIGGISAGISGVCGNSFRKALIKTKA